MSLRGIDSHSQILGTPPADVAIETDLVRRLLTEQHPDLAELPIQPVDVGWDNAMFRLGDQLAVRLPRRQAAAQLIEYEQRWLPQLAAHLPLATPVPCRLGTPALGYPWRWSVVPWLEGQTADQESPHEDQAERLGVFLRSLHQPAPPDAPINPARGMPLHHRATAVEERMVRLAHTTDVITNPLRQIWETAVAAPIDIGDRWLHGDLHARNILVRHGQITGIIDWGDITAGDIATDLAALWMLFPQPTARQRVIAAYGAVSQATLQRAQGWAILFGVVLLETGLVDHPRHAAMGANILHCLLADPYRLL